MLIRKSDHPLWKQWASKHAPRIVSNHPVGYLLWEVLHNSEADWEAMWINYYIEEGNYADQLEERGYDLIRSERC